MGRAEDVGKDVAKEKLSNVLRDSGAKLKKPLLHFLKSRKLKYNSTRKVKVVIDKYTTKKPSARPKAR